MLPVLFIGHGNPMNTLEDNAYTRSWQALVAGLPRPQAILCISAHWETWDPCLTSDEQPPTLHDFYGFPPNLHAMQYPCPGSPALARRVAELIGASEQVSGRGLDHGSWCVLAKLFPEADIPVVQMSLGINQPPAWHRDRGVALRPLREEGVLIIASGNIVHNLRRWFSGDPDFRWAVEFDREIAAAIAEGRHEAVLDYASAPHARLAVPSPEHFLPLLYALGASTPGDAIEQTAFPANSLENACMRSIRFGSIPA